MKYYKDYLNKNNDFTNLIYKKDSKSDNNKNNLEKYGMEVFGNCIDSEIFKLMKWDIKADINYNNINSDIDYPYHKNDNNSNVSLFFKLRTSDTLGRVK